MDIGIAKLPALFIHNSIIFFTAILFTTLLWKFFRKSVVAADSKYL